MAIGKAVALLFKGFLFTSGPTAFGKLVIAVAKFVVVAAATTAITRSQLDRGKPGSAQLQREVLIRSGNAPRTVVYGEAMQGGVVVYANTRLSRQDDSVFDLHLVVAHAAHECEDVTDLQYDDIFLTETTHFAWGGAVTTNDRWGPVGGVNSVELYRHLGTDTQAANSELDLSYDDIDANFRGRGICYTVHVFRFHAGNQDKFSNPPGKIRVKVKGKKVYDPSLDTSPGADPDNASYQVWSDNPILCIADYMRSYIKRVTNDRIDWADVETEAAICDATVALPASGSEARYTLNGTVSLGDGHRTNLQNMLTSCRGAITKVNGKYRIKAGAYQTPSVTINDDDIVGDPIWESVAAARDRFNTAHTQYYDTADRHQKSEGVEVQVASYVTRDNGRELVKVLDLPFTDHESEAQRNAHKALLQANEQGVVTVPLTWAGLNLAPITGAQINYGPYSWVNKTFRVLGVSIGERDAPVVAVMKEDNASAWNDLDASEYETKASSTSVTPVDPLVLQPLPGAPNFMPSGAGNSDFEGVAATDFGITIPAAQTGASVVISKAQSFVGDHAMLVTLTNGAVSDSVVVAFSANHVAKFPVRVPAGRRWMVFAHVRPNADGVNADVQFTLAQSGGSVVSTNAAIGGTADQWHQIRRELDATSTQSDKTTFRLQLFSRHSAAPAAAPAFYLDAVMLIDVTDNPEIVE